MAPRFLRTSEIAHELGIHPNTLRLYEAQDFLPAVPRGQNGYRQYTLMHKEQARLACLALQWPYVGDKSRLIDLVQQAARHDFGMAMELAYQYLAQVRVERTYAESALEFLQRWAAGHLMDSARQIMHIGQAAHYLKVTVDTLRNWERNGLIAVPRDPVNGYRLYGTSEFGRLRVIRVLVQSGYSQMAILRMLRYLDSGQQEGLRDVLEVPPEDSANEAIEIIADHWLSALLALEQRAQKIIQQIGLMIELAHQSQTLHHYTTPLE
ncbi:MAG: MerR family DNA-binding transcriptional regulator [bacterium]|nr:MerR family DNA-binding transcriptional regulator [bacterium]